MPKSAKLIAFINDNAIQILAKNSSINEKMLREGLEGYYNLSEKDLLQNKKYLELIDFTKLSNTKRLYLIDLESHETIVNCTVAHGEGSDLNNDGKAESFSNENDSHKSSLGFYATSYTYDGKHGCSLKLIGVDKGYNSNAFARYIVMHSADYVSENYAGRSWGCPAISEENLHHVVDKIKNGSCLYIFADDEGFRNNSIFLN